MGNWKKGLTNKEIITLKYHQHLEGNEEDGMMYFTLEDVHKCMDEYIDYIEAKLKNNVVLDHVSESNLIEELRFKLIGMECFADEYYNEDAKKGAKTVFEELESWINKKRDGYSR